MVDVDSNMVEGSGEDLAGRTGAPGQAPENYCRGTFEQLPRILFAEAYSQCENSHFYLWV